MNFYNKSIFKIILLLSIPIITLIMSFSKIDNGQTICLFNNILGIDCAGCGITKSIICAIKGEFQQSIQYNFNVIIILPLLLFIWMKQLLYYIRNLRRVYC